MAVTLSLYSRASGFTAKKYLVSDCSSSPAAFTALRMFMLDETVSVPPVVTRNSIDAFKKGVSRLFRCRWKHVEEFLVGLDKDQDFVICCGCSETELSRRQLAASGQFLCHLGLIGLLIQKYRSDIDVKVDESLLQCLSPALLPVESICLLCDLAKGDTDCGIKKSACAGPYEVSADMILTRNLLARRIIATF